MKHLCSSRVPMLALILILVLPCIDSFVNAQTGIDVPSMHTCDSLVQAFLTKWQVPGATVALAKDGKLVYMRAFGTANQNGTEVTQPYHMFRVVSVSKPVTAIAIMKLREAGVLNLDDHIFGPGGILQADPYIAGAIISDSRIYDITVRNCLEHTTGWNREIPMTPSPLPPYPFGFSWTDPKEFPLHVTMALGESNPVTQREMVKFLLQRGLNYTPGTEFHYGNTEYGILELVIEQLTGMSYEEYVTSAILEPLGIYDMHLGKSLLANKIEREGEYKAAFSILSSFGTGQNVPYQYGGLNWESFGGWGGWIATARDLVRLIVAVDGFSTKPDILTAASIDTMKAPSAINPSVAKGWFVDGSDNWDHNGDLSGSQCLVRRLSNGFTWAMIVNRREYTTWSQQMGDLYSLSANCTAAITSIPTFDLLEFPIQNASNITFSNNAAHSVTVNWTNGSGDGRLLLVRAGAKTSKFPLDGVSYTADSAFGSGQNLGSGNYVAYSGNGNSVTINNLFPGAVYHFRLFEYNKNGSTGNYELYQLGKSERDSVQTLPADSTSVAADIDTSAYGQMVTFTATVTPIAPEVGTPTGTVTFKAGATTIGSGILNGSAQASVSTSSLSAGNHSIKAIYGGDGSFNPDTSSEFNQTVDQSSSSTNLGSNTNPSSYGQMISLTATVAAMPPGGGTPAGTVTFKDGAATIGTGVLNGSGAATVSIDTLAIGSHSITAEYNGQANYGGSTSGTLLQTVDKATTTTSLTSSNNPSLVGLPVTFTASVTPTAPIAGIPAGTVIFKSGATTMGTSTVDDSGRATLTTDTLEVGTHPMTAEYAGDSSHAVSSSSVYDQVVTLGLDLNILAGWNMISFPFTAGDYGKAIHFPTATSNAFMYSGHYVPGVNVMHGKGVWLKFDHAQDVTLNGFLLAIDSIPVVHGWNMIGSISASIGVGQITSIPPAMSRSDFYNYDGSQYTIAAQIDPGRAYWVKVDQDGELVLSSSSTVVSASSHMNVVTIAELPPAPPESESTEPGALDPAEFWLAQNYPNPFNPATEFRYALPENGHVVLKVFNVLGQEVANVVDKIESAGYKVVSFDASKLQSGFYFFRLTAGRFTGTKKMLLLK